MRPAAVKSVANDFADLEIAQRIAAGDRDQLRLLMRRYNQRLYRTARSILKDDAEAEDAVQESYLLAYQAMGDAGIADKKERADLIAYLKAENASPPCGK